MSSGPTATPPSRFPAMTFMAPIMEAEAAGRGVPGADVAVALPESKKVCVAL